MSEAVADNFGADFFVSFSLRAQLVFTTHERRSLLVNDDRGLSLADVVSFFVFWTHVHVAEKNVIARKPALFRFHPTGIGNFLAHVAALVLVRDGLNVTHEEIGAGAFLVENFSVVDVVENDDALFDEAFISFVVREISGLAVEHIKKNVLGLLFDRAIHRSGVLLSVFLEG